MVKQAKLKPDPLPKPQKKAHQLENKAANSQTTAKSESVKSIRPKPNPLPKPQRKAHTGELIKSYTACMIIKLQYNAGKDNSAVPTDDNDDSGFAESKEFLKDQQQQSPQSPDSNPGYAKLTEATLQTPDCHTYESPNPGNKILIVVR